MQAKLTLQKSRSRAPEHFGSVLMKAEWQKLGPAQSRHRTSSYMLQQAGLETRSPGFKQHLSFRKPKSFRTGMTLNNATMWDLWWGFFRTSQQSLSGQVAQVQPGSALFFIRLVHPLVVIHGISRVLPFLSVPVLLIYFLFICWTGTESAQGVAFSCSCIGGIF